MNEHPWKTWGLRALALAALLATATPPVAFAQTTVVLVLHAEPDAAPPSADLDTRQALRWACLVGGALALTAGTAYFALGASDQSRVENAWRDDAGRIRGVTQAEAAELQSDARTQKAIGAVGLSIGAVLVATGAVLWLTEPEKVPVNAWVAAEGGGGLGLRGRF